MKCGTPTCSIDGKANPIMADGTPAPSFQESGSSGCSTRGSSRGGRSARGGRGSSASSVPASGPSITMQNPQPEASTPPPAMSSIPLLPARTPEPEAPSRPAPAAQMTLPMDMPRVIPTVRRVDVFPSPKGGASLVNPPTVFTVPSLAAPSKPRPDTILETPKVRVINPDASSVPALPATPSLDLCANPLLAGTELCRRAQEGTLNLSPECLAILRAGLAAGQSLDDLRQNELCASFASLLVPAAAANPGGAVADPAAFANACYAHFLGLSTFDQARILDDGACGAFQQCRAAAADLRNGHTQSARAAADWLYRNFPRDSAPIRDFCASVHAAAGHTAPSGAPAMRSHAAYVTPRASQMISASPMMATAPGVSVVSAPTTEVCLRYLQGVAARNPALLLGAFNQSELSQRPQFRRPTGSTPSEAAAALLNALRANATSIRRELDALCRLAESLTSTKPAGAAAPTDGQIRSAFFALSPRAQAAVLRAGAFGDQPYPAQIAVALDRGMRSIDGVAPPVLVYAYLDRNFAPGHPVRSRFNMDVAHAASLIRPAGVPTADMVFTLAETQSPQADPWAGLTGGGLGPAYNPTTGQRFDPATGQAVGASPDYSQAATGVATGVTGLIGGYLRGEQATQIAASQAQAQRDAAAASAQAQRDVAMINAQRDVQIAELRAQQGATTDPAAQTFLQQQIASIQAQMAASQEAASNAVRTTQQQSSGISGGTVAVIGVGVIALLGVAYAVTRPSGRKSNGARRARRVSNAPQLPAYGKAA